MLIQARAPGNQFLIVNCLSFGFATVFAIETLDATSRVNEFLLARKERVATRTDFKTNLRLG
jgi:hypothetical protein